MAGKLGFTFYPKDWWTSDTFFDLEAEERYLYLECLFLMYQNDGYLDLKREKIAARLRMEISEEMWKKITDYFEVDDELGFTHPSVNKRLRRAQASRENGKGGGRPKGSTKKPKKPSGKPEENLPLESEREGEEEIKTPANDESFDWGNLLKLINRETGRLGDKNREFKVINEAVRRKFRARLKEYSKTDIRSAIQNAPKDKFHKETNLKHLTPEYFSRAKTIDMYSTAEPDSEQKVVARAMRN